MSHVKIESNIPIPGPTKYSKYPFTVMNVSQSFVFSCGQDQGEFNLMRQAMTQYGRRNNKKFSTRKLGPSSWRIWRVK